MQSLGDFQGYAPMAYALKMTASGGTSGSSVRRVEASSTSVSTRRNAGGGYYSTPDYYAPTPGFSPGTTVAAGSTDQERQIEPNVERAVDEVNRQIARMNRQIERVVHEGTKTVIYRVKDMTTNEVLSEFPSENVQTIISKLWAVNGLFVDERI